MNSVKTLALVAALFASQSAFANTVPLTIDFSNGDAGGFTGGSIYSKSIGGVAAKPKGDFGDFYVVGINSTATINLASNTYNDISFIWGTVDKYNDLQVTLSDGSTKNFHGVDYKPNNGTTDMVFSFNSDTLFISKVSLINGANPAFEIDNFKASAVPEPEAYAMMLVGLGLVGFAARRKQK
jgi:hypothetical protein